MATLLEFFCSGKKSARQPYKLPKVSIEVKKIRYRAQKRTAAASRSGSRS
jgi:hypothetical protein